MQTTRMMCLAVLLLCAGCAGKSDGVSAEAKAHPIPEKILDKEYDTCMDTVKPFTNMDTMQKSLYCLCVKYGVGRDIGFDEYARAAVSIGTGRGYPKTLINKLDIIGEHCIVQIFTP